MASRRNEGKGTTMNRERFEQVLAAYGADPKRWPADERAALEAYAAANADAAMSLADARDIDAILDQAREPLAPNAQLASRILNAAPRKALRTVSFDARARWALAACALLGVIAGYGGGRFAPSASSEDTEAMALAALDAAFGDAVWYGEEG